jgi:hypothetical protein
MKNVHVENSEFDRSGNDCITAFFAGPILLLIVFAGMVFLFGGCEG